MADRTDFYFRQKVTEAELDLAFELLEKADRDLAADIGVYGIISGAQAVEHEPVADLTIDLVAPARAYDHLGQRIFFGSDQNVDCSVDLSGIPTEVSSAGNERWMGIFLRFDRLLSDPRTDGNSQQVLFRRDESFEVVIRQAAEAPIGSAPKVPLVESELLVCDVKRRAGQTQIISSDIDASRRQAFVFAQGSTIEVITNLWNIISPSSNTVQSSLDAVDELLNQHVSGSGQRHAASHINFSPGGFVSQNNVQGAVAEIVSKLSSATSGSPGASVVGADAVTGTPHVLPAGNVDSQLSSLLSFINGHVGATSGAHTASAVSVTDSGVKLDASNVEAALAETLTAFESQHYRDNQFNGGNHRTIRQPDLGSGRVLLFYSAGTGGQSARFRIFADSDDIWFTMNADWDNSNNRWDKDSPGQSGGFRFGRNTFETLYDNAGSTTFTEWENHWRLSMGILVNSAFETHGTIREVGRVALQATNTYSSDRVVSMGIPITFRNRFPATPSSVTFSANSFSYNWSGDPVATDTSRDGFVVYSYQYTASQNTAWWYGTYTAIA
jgi:hypothetical protein